MDQRSPDTTGDPVVLTGLGIAEGIPCDSRPYLVDRKNRKFMGPQDELAVIATANALQSAGLMERTLGERAGLFMAIGYIPFEKTDIELICENATDNGNFSMRQFSTVAYHKINPLLTFRCLPNMPAFHISMNFDIRGPYFVTYPGPGQYYMALHRACESLACGEADIAVVGAVAHQRNFLVEHHFRRIASTVEAQLLRDASGCLILEQESHARARSAKIKGKLRALSLRYLPHDPDAESPPSLLERCADEEIPEGEWGPCLLPVALNYHASGTFRHVLQAPDGIVASSTWEMA
ncbi:MAG: hypothetical protein HY692_00475 [Cyanobacteria bacterium NC_groundwater_1444_Ag_S-0.65um_54_12]|nr:hypothetical protein [Cyanobacteria bacterium NC_groundwater_1444_Ag_S-0.65um_54_12]